jgi:pimeloyl-ACP methyl ester carboxylesterase
MFKFVRSLIVSHVEYCDVSCNMPSFSEAFPDSAIYLLHYRGFGGSSGKPTQNALFSDALALFDQVHTHHPNIDVIGRSLGTGVATYLASQRPITRLVLVTPFDSLQEIAASQFPYVPVRWFLQDKFESWRYAPNITAPTLIIAAENDEVIPRASTELFRTRFKNGIATFHLIANVGHNNISESADYLPLLKTLP